MLASTSSVFLLFHPNQSHLFFQPYIMKAYFGMEKPPVTIAKMAIGDPSITYPHVYRMLPNVSTSKLFDSIDSQILYS